LKRANAFWTEIIDDTTYNQFWQAHSIWKYLTNVKPAVMVVGGWFDAEDLQGRYAPSTSSRNIIRPLPTCW
jgi:predicted acyl esterase